MAVSFGGKPIFGTQTIVDGPRREVRTQSERLPGVDGERVYGLGTGCVHWSVTGRLTGVTKSALRVAIEQAQALMGAKLYTFDDGRGKTYPSCQLVDFRPAGPFMPVLYAGVFQWTCRVTSTIKWLAPK